MIRFIGLVMLIVPLTVFAFIVMLWPVPDASVKLFGIFPVGKAEVEAPQHWLLAWRDGLAFEHRMLIIVLLAGLSGSFVHAATSFSSYVGNRKFVSSWAWWYFLRLPVGMGLALIVYLALRGGFLAPVAGNGVSPEEVVNPFGFAAVAALAGMFSKQATDKLREVFDSLFKTEKDDQRDDKLTDRKPVIDKVDPEKLAVGVADQTLTLTCTGLTEKSELTIDGKMYPATITPPATAVAVMSEAQVAEAGVLKLVIVNPKDAGGSSDPVPVEVV